MKVSKVALVAAMIAGGSALIAAPAAAQNRQAAQAAQGQQPAQRQPTFSRAETAALAPLQQAFNAAIEARKNNQTPDWAAVQALLPAAQSAATGDDARYLVGRVQLGVAEAQNNQALGAQALDALIANPVTPPDNLPILLNARASRAFEAQDFATAERMFERLLQLKPNDPAIVNNLGVVRARMGNSGALLDAVLQNIRTQEAANQRADEALYRRARDTSYTNRDRARTLEFATKLATNYPTPVNWRDAIRMYRELGNPSAALTLDAMRLARAAGALEGEADYLSYAQILDQAALPGESKAVLEEGIARGAYPASRQGVSQLLATANRRIAEDRAGLNAQITQARNAPNARLPRAVADALYGYGRYAEAADLYRVAAGKPGEDRNLLNLRLGSALAMAGQRGEAETVLRTVTGEPADLAKLWLAWLSRRSS